MHHGWWIGAGSALALAVHVQAGDFTKAYYAGTPPGAWSEYALTAQDGTASTYRYERRPDSDGRAVLSLNVKTTAGIAAGSESTMVYTMPRDFNLAQDGMHYGKYIEAMTMIYGDMEMPVDDATLDIIRAAEKDYRGHVAFVGEEAIGDLACDQYTYEINTDTTKEAGTLWLNDTVPFAVVKHAGTVVNTADGSVAADFSMVLVDRGLLASGSTIDEADAVEPEPPAPEPLETRFVEGFKAGHIGLDVKALDGGRRLAFTFRNENAAQLTIELPAGPVNLDVDFPVHTLRFNVDQPLRLVLEPGAISEPVIVTQAGPRGITEGKCYLSVYDGSPVFQGSVTMDQLAP